MLRTRLCDVLGIDVPIILAAMGGTASSAELLRRRQMKARWAVSDRCFEAMRRSSATSTWFNN